MTRPDISFAVSTLSRFLEQPRTTHMNAALRVIRYLKGTKHLRLILGGKRLTVTGFSDADWGSQMHRHSITGSALYVGSSVTVYSSKKQPIITMSSVEAEYVALTFLAKDVIWARKLLAELEKFVSISPDEPTRVCYKPSDPTTVFCDNQGAITLSKNSTYHARTKHIDIHFHFIRQTVSAGQISLTYCPTKEMVADIFTKSLSTFLFTKFRDQLGVLPSST